MSPDPLAEKFWLEAETLTRDVQTHLEYLSALGLEAMAADIPVPARGRAAAPVRPVAKGAPPSPPAGRPVRPASQRGQSPGGDWISRAATLEDLRAGLSACQGCPLGRAGEAAGARLGQGSERPLIAFVGESPYIYKGAAADLLAAIIGSGLKLKPEQYYVTSLIKCPLADDAEPTAEAAGGCLALLRRELTLLAPKIVLALGALPGGLLSGRSKSPLLMLRQKTQTIKGLDGAWLRVTYGLRDMLEEPILKKETWKDLQRIIQGLAKITN